MSAENSIVIKAARERFANLISASSRSSGVSAPKKTTFLMLQDRFVAGLDRRVINLRDCLGTLRESLEGRQAPETLDEMNRAFHSLAGIGGTYGFHNITEIARRGDLTCKSLDGRASDHDLKVLAEVVESLAEAASSAVLAVARRTEEHITTEASTTAGVAAESELELARQK